MSMVPELTVLDHERVQLNSARYAFTVISNVLVFVLLWLFINTMTVSIRQQFQYLALSVLAIGIGCSLFFLLATRERIKCQTDTLLDHDTLAQLDADIFAASTASSSASPLRAATTAVIASI